jgi:hypothetical protein
MRSDSAGNGWPTSLDSIDSSTGCCVLKYYTETRESSMKDFEVGEKAWLGIEDVRVGRRIRGYFAMQVENHVYGLHGLEYGIVHFIRFDTTI